ncbi:MAG: hypothetical protein LBH78_03645 [Rickettsiales bacterium]|nr:hypothetical protein [Rickettsiales bacterium]
MTETNPIITLKDKTKEFDFSKLRADKSNVGANSGATMYVDFERMNFFINEKNIDKILMKVLINRNKKEFDKIWEEYYESSGILADKKTDQHKEEVEHFYNIGQKYGYLLPEKGDTNYRPFAKEVFKEMFKYAGVETPSNSILEELVTNCNQSGYVGSLLGDESKPLTKVSFKHGLSFQSIDYTVNINFSNTNCAIIEIEEPISVCAIENPHEKMHMHSSLRFTLESQNGKDGVTYRDGKLLLNISEKLKNYQDGNKSLFDVIKEYFQKFCEKLGFKFEIKTQIEHNLDNSLKVNTHLESVKPPVCSNNYVLGH